MTPPAISNQRGALLIGSFVVLSLAWSALLGVGVAIVALVMSAAGREPDFVSSGLGPGGLGALGIIQSLGWTALAYGLTWWLPADTAGGTLVDRARSALAVQLPRSTAWWFGAAAAGAVVWVFPSWMATQIVDRLPPALQAHFGTGLEMIAASLRSESPGRVLMVIAVAVGAPLFEELIFRGFLWSVVARTSRAATSDVSGDPGARGDSQAFVATTLLFAAYHMDPVHVVTLLPTAILLGWLRLRSGSVWPGVVAHFVNNALAAALVIGGFDADLSTAAAFAGLGATLLAAGVTGRLAGLARPASK